MKSLNCDIAEKIREQLQKAPDYFEKHKSDGIDHGIYIGASLVEDKKFDLLYLKNLRLWQLMIVCGMARQAERIKENLKVPLETAHPILVQNTPLSIRFRFDEKQFDEVELEDLQGVQGLKALRVTVDMQTSAPEGMVVPEEVEEAVKAMLQVAS